MPHLCTFVNTAESIKVLPQKCFSTVKDPVENSTKNAINTEKTLWITFFTISAKLQIKLLYTKFYYSLNLSLVSIYNNKKLVVKAIILMVELKIV